ncbi:flagellar protein FlgN [Rhodopseudomonas palustris]|uniref:Flagellar basal-body protein FlbY n=1 Tax=Rhodopseudomonas palustris (strain BisB18) TaxID=316056 RepID=Q21AZ3_RHOPB
MLDRPSQQPTNASGGQRIEELVALIDALIEVVREENAALAIGLPASQSRHTELKSKLAGRFEAWVAEVSARRVRLHSPDKALQERFMNRIETLRLSMDENVIRLRAAIEASQRRIDAVMAAIREQISDVSPYSANGRVKGRAASYSAGVRA